MEILLPSDINTAEFCNEATATGISIGELEAQFMGKIRSPEALQNGKPRG